MSLTISLLPFPFLTISLLPFPFLTISLLPFPFPCNGPCAKTEKRHYTCCGMQRRHNQQQHPAAKDEVGSTGMRQDSPEREVGTAISPRGKAGSEPCHHLGFLLARRT